MGLTEEAAPLTITVFDRGDMERFAEPIMHRRNRSGEPGQSGYWILRAQCEECYTEEGGFKLPDVQKSNGEMMF